MSRSTLAAQLFNCLLLCSYLLLMPCIHVIRFQKSARVFGFLCIRLFPDVRLLALLNISLLGLMWADLCTHRGHYLCPIAQNCAWKCWVVRNRENVFVRALSCRFSFAISQNSRENAWKFLGKFIPVLNASHNLLIRLPGFESRGLCEALNTRIVNLHEFLVQRIVDTPIEKPGSLHVEVVTVAKTSALFGGL